MLVVGAVSFSFSPIEIVFSQNWCVAGKNSPKPVPERAERRGDDLLVVGLLGSKLCMGRLKKICKFLVSPQFSSICRDQRVGKVGMAVEGLTTLGSKIRKSSSFFISEESL